MYIHITIHTFVHTVHTVCTVHIETRVHTVQHILYILCNTYCAYSTYICTYLTVPYHTVPHHTVSIGSESKAWVINDISQCLLNNIWIWLQLCMRTWVLNVVLIHNACGATTNTVFHKENNVS